VAGTVFPGRVDRGDCLALSPLEKTLRVRAIHAQNHAAETGLAEERCALNIVGPDVSKNTVRRGD